MSVKSLDKLICGLCCQGWTFMFKERGAVFVSYWNPCVIIDTHWRRYRVWFNCFNSDRRMRRTSCKLASPVSVTPLKECFHSQPVCLIWFVVSWTPVQTTWLGREPLKMSRPAFNRAFCLWHQRRQTNNRILWLQICNFSMISKAKLLLIFSVSYIDIYANLFVIMLCCAYLHTCTAEQVLYPFFFPPLPHAVKTAVLVLVTTSLTPQCVLVMHSNKPSIVTVQGDNVVNWWSNNNYN